jgi:2-keto-3-deoxy-L-rhamnonate aldolase
MVEPPPPGVYVPVPTFFVSREASDRVAPQVDLATQAAHAVYLAESGITGLVVLGSMGEAVALTNAERVQILSAVRLSLKTAGFDEYPIIAGTATQSIADALHQLTEAKIAGAQWGLCLAPGFFAGQVTQEGLKEWYKAVADRSPIPIIMSAPLWSSFISGLRCIY